jgi:hypothetical protein
MLAMQIVVRRLQRDGLLPSPPVSDAVNRPVSAGGGHSVPLTHDPESAHAEPHTKPRRPLGAGVVAPQCNTGADRE